MPARYDPPPVGAHLQCPDVPESTLLVLHSTAKQLVAIDTLVLEVYRWKRHSDGWRVDFRRAVMSDGVIESDWWALPITLYPLPTEVL